jgi:glycosyltransferase involved in cell wall biosynthesis
MKLLVATQVLDENHQNLGFFVRWVAEFAKHADKVIVVASAVGTYTLPPNVTVHSLGKEVGLEHRSRVGRFFSLMFSLRHEYDAVFVHMIPEFVLAGALPWKILGKRVGLWYVHGTVSWYLRLAAWFVHFIATASPESCRLTSSKVHVVGHGIDTDFFTPDPTIPRTDGILSVGRLSESKRHDLAIRAAATDGRAIRIAGEGPEQGTLENLVTELHVDAKFLGGLTQAELRDEYRRAAYVVHMSETGSMDKVVLEALATDTPVVTTSSVYKDFPMDAGIRAAYIHEHHSLTNLIPKILALYA